MRNTFRKTILQGVLLFMLLAAPLPLASHLLRPTDIDKCICAIDVFHSMPENSFDVIGYGSSRMWDGLDANRMYENYGLRCYNYGCNWQGINTTALFFYDSLRTQKPSIALIEASFIDNVIRDTDLSGEVYYTRAIPDQPEKRRYLRQVFGKDYRKYISYYVPVLALHSNWKQLSADSFKPVRTDIDFAASHGYVSSGQVYPVTMDDPAGFEQCGLSHDARDILDRMTETAKENGIQLIFYNSPCAGPYNYHDVLSTYAEEHGIIYIDMFYHLEEMGFDPAADFRDPDHLNASGAAKLTDYLGRYILENCLAAGTARP